jgi:iron complex outermembrane recepter protein
MSSTPFTWLAASACLTTLASSTPHLGVGEAPLPAVSSVAIVAPALVGAVRDSAGAPLANVQVIIASLNRVATTNSAGAFVFRGLPAGHYHLDAIFLGYARADAEVNVPATGDDVQVTIVMRRTALRLGGVVIAASPSGSDAIGITQSTIDLSGKELARNLGSSVAQTLSSEPGMAMRYGGPAATTPIIRGLSGERILVLQDGDRTGDLSAASSDHSLSIDPLAANRIEVVRGPASLLYGTNALGGVVNVVSNEIPTSVPSRAQGSIAGMAERATPGGAGSGQVTIPIGSSLALSVRGGARSSGNGYVGGGERLLNSSFRNNSAGAGLGYVGSGVTAGVAASRYDFRYGLPAPFDDEELGGKIDGRRDQLRGRVEFGGNSSGFFRLVRIDAAAQWYAHNEIENSGAIGTSFDLKTQTANATVKTVVGRVEGAIGFNGIFRQYAATGEEALTPAANTSGGGIFVFQEIPLAGKSGDDTHALVPRLQLGGRVDLLTIASKTGETKFGSGRSLDFNSGSGSIGLTLPFSERVSLGVSAARAFRAPTVEELFSNAFHAAVGTYDVGNPSLEAEINQGVDAVLRADGRRLNGELSGYYNRVSNFVAPSIVKDTVTDEGTVPLNRFAQGNASLRGIEGRVEGTIVPHVVLGAMGDVVRGRFTDGAPLPFMPAARIGAQGRWERGIFSLATEVRHAFAQERVSGGAVDIPTAAYTLLNASLGVQYTRAGLVHIVTLRADNLTDERYFDASSRIKNFAANPGRNIAVVYKVLF